MLSHTKKIHYNTTIVPMAKEISGYLSDLEYKLLNIQKNFAENSAIASAINTISKHVDGIKSFCQIYSLNIPVSHSDNSNIEYTGYASEIYDLISLNKELFQFGTKIYEDKSDKPGLSDEAYAALLNLAKKLKEKFPILEEKSAQFKIERIERTLPIIQQEFAR